jgi:hypothetical protein
MKFSLGALDCETDEYTMPSLASKKKEYKCPDCLKKVIPRQGTIRAHHYAHYSETNICSYYEHPNEAQIHKDAKLLMKKLLDDKRLISFTWECDICSGFYGFSDTSSIDYIDGDMAKLEYRSKDGKWVADVAIVNGESVRYIIEIKNTHITTNTRPEPWYEVSAEDFIKQVNEYANDKNLKEYINDKDFIFDIPCIRKDLVRRCYGSFCYKEPWVRRIPGYNDTNEDNTCLICKKIDYEPISDGCTAKFQNGEIRVCFDCLKKDIVKKKIRTLYASDKAKLTEFTWQKNGTIDTVQSIQEFSNKEKEILKKIPRLPTKFGKEFYWEQTMACIECGRFKYSPVYFEKSYYAVCKICLANENTETSIQTKIQKNIKIESICMIIDN